jgi:hypothetical protein
MPVFHGVTVLLDDPSASFDASVYRLPRWRSARTHAIAAMKPMTFELTYHIRKDEKIISRPGRDDLREAYRVLREENVEVADLRNVQTGALLQLVTLDGGDCVCAAMFPFDDATGALYSESDALTIVEALVICDAFMRSGDARASGMTFSDKDWFERPEEGNFAPVPRTPTGAADEPDDHAASEEEELAPQELINLWLEDPGFCTEDLVRSALDSGGTFAASTPIPPLIYVAQHGGQADAIGFLLSLGEDIGTIHDGGTALWHAISNSNYCFADELLIRGAQSTEARSSKNFSRWQKRDEHSKILDAIAAGQAHTVDAYLVGRHPRQVSIDLLSEAIASSQLAILERLLSHKGKLSVKSTTLWGLAMAKSDVRYLQALIDHGVYDSIVALQDFDGRAFQYATPEALSFLVSNGHTAGFEEGCAVLSGRRGRRARALLPIIPDAFFYRLSAKQLANVILIFEQLAPERVDTILEQNDFAPLLRHVFHGADGDDAYRLMPTILGLPFIGPHEEDAPTLETLKNMRVIRDELTALARALI